MRLPFHSGLTATQRGRHILTFPFSVLHLVAVAVIKWIKQITKPTTGFVEPELVLDVTRSKHELIAEDALLRQQLIILRRGQKRPPISNGDRLKLLFWARLTPSWKQVLHIVQPETLLRWHRDLFRLAWRWKSRATSRKPRASRQVIALINRMASENLTWGAERIRGELLKLGITLSKRTIQKYLAKTRIPSPSG